MLELVKDFRDSNSVRKYSKNKSLKENTAKLACCSNDLRTKVPLISSMGFFPRCCVGRDLGPCKQTELG